MLRIGHRLGELLKPADTPDVFGCGAAGIGDKARVSTMTILTRAMGSIMGAGGFLLRCPVERQSPINGESRTLTDTNMPQTEAKCWP